MQRAFIVGSIGAVLFLVGSIEVARADEDDRDCTSYVSAVYSSIDTTNCAGVCTTGQLAGPPGLFHTGTSHFVVTTLDSSTPIWRYTGQFDLTTAGGTLSVLSTGTIDFTTTPPSFSETERVISGTGIFERARGHNLSSAGTFDGTTFLGTISGRLCLRDRDHDHDR